MEVLAVLLLVTLAVAAPVEVPAAEEFHEAMMNSDTTETFNPRVLDVVDELNVTSDTIMGYPDESRDFFEEIRNGDNGVNLAAVVLFIAVLLGATAALCMACCCVSKTIKEWKKKQNTKDVVPNDDVVPTQSTPPSDSSAYSINVCRKVEYIPKDRNYFI